MWSTSNVHSDLNCGLHYGLIVYNINLVNVVSQCFEQSKQHTHTVRFADIFIMAFVFDVCVASIAPVRTDIRKYVCMYEMDFANQFSINVTNEVK